MHHGYSAVICSRISVSQSFESEVKLCPQVMLFSFYLGMNPKIVPQYRSVFPGAFGRNAHQNRYKPPGHSPLGRFREYKAHLHGSFQHIQQLIVHQKAVGVDLGDPDFPLGKLPDDLLETPAYQGLTAR